MMTATKYLDFPYLYELLTETVPPRLLSPRLNRVFSLLSQVKPFFEPRHLELDAVPDSEFGTGKPAPLTRENSRLDYLSRIITDLREPLAVSGSLIKNVSQLFQIDVAEAETTSTPTVETDKQDYQPGETATITATGFDPGAVVKLQVQHLEAGADGEFGTADDVLVAPSDSGKGHYPWVVKDGSPKDLDGLKNGTIVTEWYVNPDDSANETFQLTATDLKTGEAAEPHIFTDSVLDLTQNQSGFVNGAYIVRADLASGAGTNDSFLKLKATPEEEGYNTDAAVSQPDVQSARSLQLSELQQVTIGGETFREIRLDLNEKNSASEITLQEFRLFLGNSATLSAYDPSNQTLIGALNNGQAVFDLDSSVLLDAGLTPGTSSFDASIYVPETAFSGATGSTYVYLFSKLVSSDGGFEEFAVADVAGIDPEGTISGRVFEDLNGDGDDEAGADPDLDNVTIKLFLDDGDGIFEANEGAFDPTKDSLVTTTTSVNGSYSFSDVLGGDYFVRQVTPTGFIQTTTAPNLITIGSSTTVTGIDFGNVEEFGSISGQKFEDIDGDGVKDAGETGLAGWTIFIDSDNDGVKDAGETSTVTDSNGDYSFTDLSAGTYTIREVQQTSWLQTTTNPSAINVTSGTDTTGVDFGNFQLGTISGQKFEDSDGDGVKDAGEAGLADWTIFIDSDDDGVLDAGETSTTTDASGNYSFTDLTVGTYTIREVQQTGWVQKTANPSPILVESGTNATDIDFGNRQEVDLEVVKTFIPTYEGQNIAIPNEEFSYTLTVINNGLATAESVLITDIADLQLNVSELIIPVGAINLDEYDPDQDGTIDPYIAANGQSLIGDGNPDSVEVVIPSLSSGESAQFTVKTIVSSEYVQTNNIYASLGENSELSEYNNTQVQGKSWLPVNKIDKVAGSSIVNVQQNLVGGQVSVTANGANVFESNTSNNTSADYGTIPFMQYIGTLSNGEQVRLYSDLFDPQTDDPLNPEYATILDFDYCISTVTGQIVYDNCNSLIASGQAYNTSAFLPDGTEGAAALHFNFDNKGLISLIPNEWNAFLALDTFTDPTAAQQIVEFNQQLMEEGHAGADIFTDGALQLTNPNTNQTELLAITEAQVTPDFVDNVIILVKSDGVYFADENLTPGTQIINYNDLQDALNTLAPATNPLSSLKIVMDSSVTTTRLRTLDLNSLQDKGYLATDLEILGTTMTFDTQNGKGDIDLSQLNVIAPVNATVKLKGSNGADTIEGSSFSEIIEGNNGSDELIGNLGDDQLWGNLGADLMRGDGGDDLLVGGSGSDTLRGGFGADILVGANYDVNTQTVTQDGSTDVYVLEENAGLDIVRGYDVGSDQIGLLGILQNDIVLTQQGADSIISLNGEDIMQVEGVNTANLAFTTSFSYI
ncbi:SdrD B-like domain-containing protein [Coleofasciculus chthonoplastes]|uniref:SdrD B-like domain-containing protein n=1 Tax=Coleofasciculus chthonoplastes TaxID=64178 RepID=UPI0032F74C22